MLGVLAFSWLDCPRGTSLMGLQFVLLKSPCQLQYESLLERNFSKPVVLGYLDALVSEKQQNLRFTTLCLGTHDCNSSGGGDDVVGAVTCRWVPSKEGLTGILGSSLYVEFLVVDIPYRRLGIGTVLLEKVEQWCRGRYVHSIGLHTPASNILAINWYQSHGFLVSGEVPDYYTNTGCEHDTAGTSMMTTTAILLTKHI